MLTASWLNVGVYKNAPGIITKSPRCLAQRPDTKGSRSKRFRQRLPSLHSFGRLITNNTFYRRGQFPWPSKSTMFTHHCLLGDRRTQPLVRTHWHMSCDWAKKRSSGRFGIFISANYTFHWVCGRLKLDVRYAAYSFHEEGSVFPEEYDDPAKIRENIKATGENKVIA